MVHVYVESFKYPTASITYIHKHWVYFSAVSIQYLPIKALCLITEDLGFKF